MINLKLIVNFLHCSFRNFTKNGEESKNFLLKYEIKNLNFSSLTVTESVSLELDPFICVTKRMRVVAPFPFLNPVQKKERERTSSSQAPR